MTSAYRDPAAAATYRRIAMPAQFARPARDLVTMLDVAAGDVVLDVGSGTGAFAGPASEAVGSSGFVVALDLSIEMLQASDTEGQCRLVVGQTPGLPFFDAIFDVAAACFVLPHCPDDEAALADMIRACRPGGRIGITTWGATPNEAGQLWAQVAAGYVDDERVRQAFHGVIPRQEWFSLSRNLERALADAGLTAMAVETREYTVAITPADYLAMKEAGTDGAVIRQNVDAGAWEDFERDIREVFCERFSGVITFTRDVHFGVGTKR